MVALVVIGDIMQRHKRQDLQLPLLTADLVSTWLL